MTQQVDEAPSIVTPVNGDQAAGSSISHQTLLPFYWVWSESSFEEAKAAMPALDICGFSAKGGDKNGRPIIRLWNGKNEKVGAVLFRHHKRRMNFAKFLTEHLGITTGLKDGVALDAMGRRQPQRPMKTDIWSHPGADDLS